MKITLEKDSWIIHSLSLDPLKLIFSVLQVFYICHLLWTHLLNQLEILVFKIFNFFLNWDILTSTWMRISFWIFYFCYIKMIQEPIRFFRYTFEFKNKIIFNIAGKAKFPEIHPVFIYWQRFSTVICECLWNRLLLSLHKNTILKIYKIYSSM